MNSTLLLLVILLLTAVSFQWARRKAFGLASGGTGKDGLHSRPVYYGSLTAIWCGVPALFLLAVWQLCEPFLLGQLVLNDLAPLLQGGSNSHLEQLLDEVRRAVSSGLAGETVRPALQTAVAHYARLQLLANVALSLLLAVLICVGLAWSLRRLTPTLRARNEVEKMVTLLLFFCSTIAVITTIGLVLSVLFEAIRFFKVIPITDFLFGTTWSPQTAIRSDQVGSSGAFGALPIFTGTLLISGIAMAVAVPIGLMAAIYLAEYADRRFRAIAKPLLEILAGIPTVVYGFFAALTVAPVIRDYGAVFGLDVASESALGAGLVMGIMIIPFVSSLSDDVLTGVPQSMRDGAYGLGATQSETIRQILLPAALPGIVGGVLLAVSRAIGETMIVVMAAGLSANLTANPFQAVTTVTVQIVTLLVGDQEFDSPKTLAAFALGLVLFVVTLILNIIALWVVRKYREQYE